MCEGWIQMNNWIKATLYVLSLCLATGGTLLGVTYLLFLNPKVFGFTLLIIGIVVLLFVRSQR